MPTAPRRFAPVLFAAVLAVTGACGDDDDEGQVQSPDSSEDSTADAPAGDEASPGAPDSAGDKPAVTLPEGEPPAELVIQDITVGDGPEVTTGQRATVHYVGVFFDGGEQFDASWDRGQPFPFTIGAREVIPGWDQGVAGMKVGGRRQLVIPPDLAYGPGGRPGIPANSTLVFVIDLISVG